MRVIIRAFNADGFHKDIAVLDDQQVRLTCTGIGEPKGDPLPEGPAVAINPDDFPEVDRFEVIVDTRK